jgi:hypothetical protein
VPGPDCEPESDPSGVGLTSLDTILTIRAFFPPTDPADGLQSPFLGEK